MPTQSEPKRPDAAIFADGSEAGRPLAIHPEAINVAYPTRKAEDIWRCKVVDGVAVYAVEGPLEHKGCGWWSFWQTYEQIAADFKALMDDGSVTSVILKINSPGGEVSGLNETVRIMQGMKREADKPVIAYVDESCYSAAYALAMVADEIYLPESGGVGSIGVITALADMTKANEKAGVRVEVIASGSKKTDGHPCVPLSDGAIKRTRQTVDKLATFFFELVSEARGLPTKTIAGFQAGIFLGAAAVDAGLADGVMSLSECLTSAKNAFSSSKEPTDQSVETETKPMPPVLAATKALNDANKQLAAAKTEADRALAAAKVVAAETELAKVKKTKTVTTDTHEEEVDDGEPEDTDDEDDDAEGDGDDESAEAPDCDDEDNATKSTSSRGSARGIHRIIALARKITGKTSDDEVEGALQAMADSHRKTAKLATEVAELKANATKRDRDELIAKGLKAGKLTPGQKAWAKTLTPAALKAYLDAAPKMVHTAEEETTEARVSGSPIGAVSAEMAKIWKKQGFAEKDFPKLLEKLNGAHKGANGVS